MEKENKLKEKYNYCKQKLRNDRSNGSCFYFMGFFGAAFYFISAATSFGAGFLGVLKALIWPALMVFNLFQQFNA